MSAPQSSSRRTRSILRAAIEDLPQLYREELCRIKDVSVIQALSVSANFATTETHDSTNEAAHVPLKWYLHRIGPTVELKVTKYRCTDVLAPDVITRSRGKSNTAIGPERYFLVLQGPDSIENDFNRVCWLHLTSMIAADVRFGIRTPPMSGKVQVGHQPGQSFVPW